MLYHIAGDLLLELLHEEGQLRPGADEAHVALEDVEELGQLIHRALADQGAEPGLAVVHVFAPAGVFAAVHPHGAEFVHVKVLFVLAHTLLPENDGTGGGQLHADGGDQHQRRGQNDEYQRADDIRRPLEEGVAQIVQRNTAQVDERQAVDAVELGVCGHVAHVGRHHGQLGTVLFAGVDDAAHPAAFLGGQGHHHLVRLLAGEDGVQLLVAAAIGQGIPAAALGHVADDPKAQVLIHGDAGQVRLRALAVTHQQHPLLVVAHGAAAPQQQAHGGAFAGEQQGTDGVEEHHRPTGGLAEAQHVDGSHDDQRHQQLQRRHAAGLHMEAHGTKRLVQPCHGEHRQRQGRGHHAQPDIVVQGHAPHAAEQAEAQPVGHKHGQKYGQSIGKDVQLVEQTLIFPHHRVFPSMTDR